MAKDENNLIQSKLDKLKEQLLEATKGMSTKKVAEVMRNTLDVQNDDYMKSRASAEKANPHDAAKYLENLSNAVDLMMLKPIEPKIGFVNDLSEVAEDRMKQIMTQMQDMGGNPTSALLTGGKMRSADTKKHR